MSFCRSCKHWNVTFSREHGKVYGECLNPVVKDKIIVDKLEDLFLDGKAIYSERHYGCIYFTPMQGNIITQL